MKLLRKSIIVLLLFTFSMVIIPMILLNGNTQENMNNQQDVKISTAVTITITSNIDQLEDGSYKVGSVLTLKVSDNTNQKIYIELHGPKRFFNFTLIKSGSIWEYKCETNNPNPGTNDPAVDLATYDIKLYIDGVLTTSTPSTIVISTGESNLLLFMIILIVIIAGVGISGLIIVKKKRAAGDVEFGRVDKTKSKKKGKVYKGASAIGKRSGQMAESKTETSTSKGDSKKPKEKKKKKPEEFFKTEETPSKASTNKKMLMPADSSFKFETRSSTSVAMVKDMELKMNIEQKINFLTSKVDAVLQNIEFFKAILQQNDQEELACQDCSRKMSGYWSQCPFCVISEHDSELGLKASMLSISGEVGFCPKCKRVIQPNWCECPYCFATKQ